MVEEYGGEIWRWLSVAVEYGGESEFTALGRVWRRDCGDSQGDRADGKDGREEHEPPRPVNDGRHELRI